MPYRTPQILEIATHGPAQSSGFPSYSWGAAVVLNETDFLVGYMWGLPPPPSGLLQLEVIKGKMTGSGSTLNEVSVIDTGTSSTTNVRGPTVIDYGVQWVRLNSTQAMILWRRDDPAGAINANLIPSCTFMASVITYGNTGSPPGVGPLTRVTFVGPVATRHYQHSGLSSVLRPDGSVVLLYMDENVPVPLVLPYAENLRATHLAISGTAITPSPSGVGVDYAINTGLTSVIAGGAGNTELANLDNGEMLSCWRASPGASNTRWQFLQQSGNIISQVGPGTSYNQTFLGADTGRFRFAVVNSNRLREMSNTTSIVTGTVVRERAIDTAARTVENPPSFEETADTGWDFGVTIGSPLSQSRAPNNDLMWLTTSRLASAKYIDILRQKLVPYAPLDTGQLNEPLSTNTNDFANITNQPQSVVAGHSMALAYTFEKDTGLVTVRIMVIAFTDPPLRWRQRDDCLTPGTATPCLCFFVVPNVLSCVPDFRIWLTSSVQFGGRVGTRNTYY